MARALPDLPITPVLPEISDALRRHGRVVLQAPPGAGKTTLVPLHLLAMGGIAGRILMLEPRRVAARTAAERMAAHFGEKAGETVGYRMRGATRISAATRIEVVTEGVLTRMIQNDAELPGIGCIIFDEFHERALQADLGLALALEIRAALRPDLKLVVMSATLDAAPVAALMDDAPVITSAGRAFDVATIWADMPWSKRHRRIEDAVAETVIRAAAETTGGMLVFLPGAGEIRRVAGKLAGKIPDADIRPLYGALPFRDQMAALAPAPPGRRALVLATAIAETSLTIPEVRVVVDAGLARRARFDPRAAMARLVTERASKAEVTQRQGRAGRVADGWCYRLWTRGEEGGMAPFPPVEIEDDDLMGLALELAIWGAGDAAEMPFLTPPPAPTLMRARAMLAAFGALDARGGITAHGRALAAVPAHPRLAQMILRGRAADMAETGVVLAAILSGRDPVSPGDVDIARRIAAVRGTGKEPRLMEIRADIKRLGGGRDTGDLSPGAVLSLAYPDRIARRRTGTAPRYHLSGGKGAVLPNDDPLAGAEWLVVADLDGDTREARVRMAAPLRLDEIRTLHGAAIERADICAWDARAGRVVAERQERLGALILDRRADPAPDALALAAAMLDGVRALGLGALPWDKPARRLCDRVEWLRARGNAAWPAMDDTALLEAAADWLLPSLSGMRRREDLAGIDLRAALETRIGWDRLREMDRLMPAKFIAPTGTGVAIDYAGDMPKISIRLQEMMGLARHPTVGSGGMPLLIELLSPAQRPIQTTADLPGFWASSYAEVRKEMRGRYPRHHWPENPAEAAATRRAKRRGE